MLACVIPRIHHQEADYKAATRHLKEAAIKAASFNRYLAETPLVSPGFADSEM